MANLRRIVHTSKDTHFPFVFYFVLSLECGIFVYNNTIAIMKEQVIKAMRDAGKPVSAGDVTKILCAERKEVDKAFAELKKEGAIVSPVRCKWEPSK